MLRALWALSPKARSAYLGDIPQTPGVALRSARLAGLASLDLPGRLFFARLRLVVFASLDHPLRRASDGSRGSLGSSCFPLLFPCRVTRWGLWGRLGGA